MSIRDRLKARVVSQLEAIKEAEKPKPSVRQRVSTRLKKRTVTKLEAIKEAEKTVVKPEPKEKITPDPLPEPEIYQKDVALKPNQSVIVTFDVAGKIQRVGTHVGKLDEIQQQIMDRGGHIVKVHAAGTAGVIYTAPTSAEWKKTMDDYYKEQFEEHGYIPEEVKEQITVPPEYYGIEQRGKLEQLLERAAYEEHYDLPTEETEKDIIDLLGKSKWYMETQAKYGEDKKTFKELKAEEPAIYLSKKPSGEFFPEYDIKRYKQEEFQREPDIMTHAWKGGMAGVMHLVDFSYWSAVLGGRGAEYLYEKEYGIKKEIESGDWGRIVGKWAEVQAPYYEQVILPLATAGVFKYISAGARVAKAGTAVGAAYKYFVAPSAKVIQYGAIPVIIGTDIGRTAAYEMKGYELPGTTIGKIGAVTTGFAVFGAGLKYWDVPSETLTHMAKEMRYFGRDVKSTFYEQFPGAKQTRLNIREFRQLGTQRHEITFLRMRHKYFGPVGEKLSSFKYQYKKAFKEQFPKTTTAMKQVSTFKETGKYPKEKLIFEDVKRLQPSEQYPMESFVEYKTEYLKLSPRTPVKPKILKYPAEGTGLKGTRPLDYYVKSDAQPVRGIKKSWRVTDADIAKWEKISFKAQETLRHWKTFEGLPKTKTLIGTKLSTMKDYNIQMETYLQATTKTMKSFKKFAPPKHRPLTIEEYYAKVSKTAKTDFLKGDKAKVSIQKHLPVEYRKTKYLIVAKGDRAEVLKLEADTTVIGGKTPLTFKKAEITLKDIVGKKPVAPTSVVTKDVGVTRGLKPQAPLLDTTSTGFRMPGGWAIATGGISLKTLEFLEEGLDIIHPHWGRPSKIDSMLLTKPEIIIEKKKDVTGVLTVEPLLSMVNVEEFLSKKKPRIDIFKKQKPDVAKILTPFKGIIPDVSQSLLQDVALIQKTDLLMDLDYKFELDQPIITITEKPPPPIPPPPLIPEDMISKKKELLLGKKEETGFNVYVKARTMYHGKIVKPTKFKRMNKEPLTESDALALGGTIADNTSAISFKIKPTKGTPTRSKELIKPWRNIKHKFTKKGKVYIEKTKHRIDTPGEIKGITALGWKSKKENLIGNKRRKNVRYI